MKTDKTLVDQIEKETLRATESGLKAKIEKTGGSGKKKGYVLDLRIHSPAALSYSNIEGIDTAPALVRLAKVKGLDVIGVTDFYDATFIDRIAIAAREASVVVIPGVDVRCVVGSCDDVVLTCLFPQQYSSAAIQEFITAIGVPEHARGNSDYVLRTPAMDVISAVEQRGGFILPARIDKTPNRLSAVPELVERFGFRTFDLAYTESDQFFKRRWPKVKFNLFSFSSASSLAQVGSRCEKVKMDVCTYDSVKSLVARSDNSDLAAIAAQVQASAKARAKTPAKNRRGMSTSAR